MFLPKYNESTIFDVFPIITQFWVKLTDKEQVSNWKVCNQKDETHYFLLLTATYNYNHSLIIVDAVLLPNNCVVSTFW